MSETPSYTPAPRKRDDAAILDDVFQANEQQPTPEATKAASADRLKVLLPGFSAANLKALAESLSRTGTLDAFLALTADPKI